MATHRSEHSTHYPYHYQTQVKKILTPHNHLYDHEMFNVNTLLLLNFTNCIKLYSFVVISRPFYIISLPFISFSGILYLQYHIPCQGHLLVNFVISRPFCKLIQYHISHISVKLLIFSHTAFDCTTKSHHHHHFTIDMLTI